MSKLNIIMYHYVRDLKNSRYPNIKGLDYSLFKEQLEFLRKNYNFVTVEEVIATFDEKIALPKNAALLTFDDGYIDNFTYVFPLLNKLKIQGVFFIPGKTFSEHVLLDVNKIHFILASASSDLLLRDLFEKLNFYRNEYDIPTNDELFNKYAIDSRWDSKEVIFIKRMLQKVLPEKLRNDISSELFDKHVGISENQFARELYMNFDQIQCMNDNGMFIGLHGYDHYWLANLPKEKMEEDINKALKAMSGIVNENKWILNYPYGSWNDNVINYIKQKGCKLSMTTEVRVADTDLDNRFLLPRLDTNDYPPKSNNYKMYL